LLYAHAFHPQLPLDALGARSPEAELIAAQRPDAGALAGGRVFAWPGSSVEPDQLLPLGVPEIGGYSSLQSSRSIAYTTYLRASDGPLLDLGDVHWVAVPRRDAPFLEYEGTGFDVARPLFSS